MIIPKWILILCLYYTSILVELLAGQFAAKCLFRPYFATYFGHWVMRTNYYCRSSFVLLLEFNL